MPDIYAAWDEAGYGEPSVEERFGADVSDRTTLTLPLVASLGTSDQAGDQVERPPGFCSEPRSKGEIQRHLGISSERYVRQVLIRPLLDDGRLVQAIPDKPRSPTSAT